MKVRLEDDLLLLTPRELRVPALQAQFAEEMAKAGVSLADLLAGLAEERQASGTRSAQQALGNQKSPGEGLF